MNEIIRKLPIVLVIDDEQDLNQIICDAFEDEDYTIYPAFSAEEGLLQLQKNKVDVCIVDMRLPGMTGNEFILAAHRLYPAMKFIIHTGSTDYFIPEEIQKIGVKNDHLLMKPVLDLTDIIDGVVEVYNR